MDLETYDRIGEALFWVTLLSSLGAGYLIALKVKYKRSRR